MACMMDRENAAGCRDNDAMSRLRQATRDDTAELWRVRYAVTENTLTPGRISDAELHAYLEDYGRGWVVELAPGRIAGFSIGDARDGHIWAMFVDPPLHGQGHGRVLHDVMVNWLFEQGHQRLDLGTMPNSRAEAGLAMANEVETSHGPHHRRRVLRPLSRQ
jgi:GNAT superfamily N-acetyltransferase